MPSITTVMKSGLNHIAPTAETITPLLTRQLRMIHAINRHLKSGTNSPVIDGPSAKGLFLPDTPHISEMNKAEYDKLYKEFDPCEYCPVYSKCNNPVKELEDAEPKHVCPNTKKNFLRIYE